ncbi:MAG: hypothetical protein Q4P24_17100 [Rhodobacterales bacterium]|nr:hypothetical protein [Rhodobacterales bacterium]
MIDEPDNISGPISSVAKGRSGQKQPQDVVYEPLRHADAIDSWQEKRWAACAFCRSKDAELRELVRARIAVLPTKKLIRKTSTERQALELKVREGIHQVEAYLANELEHILTADLSSANALTEYIGLTGQGFDKPALGGSGPPRLATIAVRASPGRLGMIGLGVAAALVTPMVVTLGAAAFSLSTATMARGKRQDYLTSIQNRVTQLLIARDCADGSVLSRHLERLDQVYGFSSKSAS